MAITKKTYNTSSPQERELKEVLFRDLTPTKWDIPWSAFDTYLKAYQNNKELDPEPPTIIKIDEHYLIWDGHSRIRAAWDTVKDDENREKTMLVWVTNHDSTQCLEFYTELFIKNIEIFKKNNNSVSNSPPIARVEIKGVGDEYVGIRGGKRKRVNHSIHWLICFSIIAWGGGLFSLLVIFLNRESPFRIYEMRYWAALGFLCIAVGFWLTYFFGKAFGAGTLREFLDVKTYRLRDVSPHETAETIELRQKTTSERSAAGIFSQGMFISSVALFLGPILNPSIPLHPYQLLLQPVVAVLGIVAVLLMLWSVDLLDTVQNTFTGNSRERLKWRRYFMREAGHLNGGITYRYDAFIVLTIFVIAAVSFFKPLSTCYAVTFLVFLGYPVMYSYRVYYEDSSKAGNPDPKSGGEKTKRPNWYHKKPYDAIHMEVTNAIYGFYASLLAIAIGCTVVALHTKPPKPPVNPIGRPLANNIQLSWGGVANAAGYRVYRFEDDKTSFCLGAPTKPSFIDEYVQPGGTYCYQVTASNLGGESTKVITAPIVMLAKVAAVTTVHAAAVPALPHDTPHSSRLPKPKVFPKP